MKKRLISISPWQSAKTFALVYFALGVLFAIPFGLLVSAMPTTPGQSKPGIIFFICMPFLYAAAALIFVPLGCWLYNMAARITGGIEVGIQSEADA